jgi:hypothetical protein
VAVASSSTPAGNRSKPQAARQAQTWQQGSPGHTHVGGSPDQCLLGGAQIGALAQQIERTCDRLNALQRRDVVAACCPSGVRHRWFIQWRRAGPFTRQHLQRTQRLARPHCRRGLFGFGRGQLGCSAVPIKHRGQAGIDADCHHPQHVAPQT